MDEISGLFSNAAFSIFGDFNVPFIKWNILTAHSISHTLKPGSLRAHQQIYTVITDTLSVLGLEQINNNYNSVKLILDLVFYNLLNYSIFSACDVILPIDNYHPPLIFIIHTEIFKTAQTNLHKSNEVSFIYDFSRANLTAICNFLNNVYWSRVLDNCSVDDTVSGFYKNVYTVFDLFVSLIKLTNLRIQYCLMRI